MIFILIVGVYDFSRLLAQESQFMGERIMEYVIRDITALSQKGRPLSILPLLGAVRTCSMIPSKERCRRGSST
jgi:hypothetical protein